MHTHYIHITGDYHYHYLYRSMTAPTTIKVIHPCKLSDTKFVICFSYLIILDSVMCLCVLCMFTLPLK